MMAGDFGLHITKTYFLRNFIHPIYFKWKIKNQKVKEDKEIKKFLPQYKEFLATEAHKNLQ